MKKFFILTIKKAHHHIITPIRMFLQDSRAVGIILIICTAVSLMLANFGFSSNAYTKFFQMHVPLSFGSINLPENPLSIVNDVLMTFFFFLVALEIKRELTVGELASIKRSLLPVLAALGGMVCPALIFAVFNSTSQFSHGWGIPMATDIAFSLGVLSLLGKKVPVQLKIFLAALAIIDDLGAIVTIAIFYTSSLHWIYLLCGVGLIGVVILLNVLKVKQSFIYFVPAAGLWYCLFNSGIHPTISGVIMAFAMPLNKLENIQKYLYYPVNFVIMPLFALANTAIILPSHFSDVFTSTISFGIVLGLVAGKPLGIFMFCFIATRLGIAHMPSRSTYTQLLGIGMLGGIGFTMSIFTSTLAFDADAFQIISKVAIICASVLSSIIGYSFLNRKEIAQAEIKPVIKKKIRPAFFQEKEPAITAIA